MYVNKVNFWLALLISFFGEAPFEGLSEKVVIEESFLRMPILEFENLPLWLSKLRFFILCQCINLCLESMKKAEFIMAV